MTRRLMLCDCEGTMRLDAEAIGRATGFACGKIGTALCTSGIGGVAEALEGDAPITIACAQEAPTFAALAEELGVEAPACIDIRDRAGWSDEAEAATPKIAALLNVTAAAARRGARRRVRRDGARFSGAPDVALPPPRSSPTRSR